MPQKSDYSQNLSLIEQYKSGDKQALEKLTIANLGLVRSIAKRFCGRGYDYEDLVETGIIGLLKALDGFDTQKNASFSTYAFVLITGEIKKLLRDTGPIKVSRSARANAQKVLCAREQFYKNTTREPRISELCEITSLCEAQITEALSVMCPIASLDEKICGEHEGFTLADTLSDTDTIEKVTDSLALRQAIMALEETERKIILLRFFKNLTQTNVAKLLGISQVTVSRTEKKIIDKLRQEIL